MQNVIYVEGIADEVFLKDIIATHIPSVSKVVFEKIKTCKFSKDAETRFQEKKRENDNLLVIFDADVNYTTTQQYLNGVVGHTPIYLFPDNKSSGCLENLLLDIIPSTNQPVVQCFKQYENCIQSLHDPSNGLTIYSPLQKSVIYAYIESLIPISTNDLIKEKNRKYTNGLWDLNSHKLNDLVQFLQDNLK